MGKSLGENCAYCETGLASSSGVKLKYPWIIHPQLQWETSILHYRLLTPVPINGTVYLVG